LAVRQPDHYLGAQGSFGEQVAIMFPAVEKLLLDERPDRLLILGDTNSGLAAVIAKRLGIPVYHMEAGNRCYDDRVPEEVNRRIIDHSSDVLMPYTENSRQNLIAEGIPRNRIYVTGNPIKEVIDYYESRISASEILETLDLRPSTMDQRSQAGDYRQEAGDRTPDLGPPISDLRPQEYFLVTMHRAENVDIEERLKSLIQALHQLHEEYGVPIIVSTHPRTRARMESFGVDVAHDQIRFLEPFGLFDFITLEKNATCVLSDSGTVQEECCIFGVPNVTLRDVTERPETIECGSNVLSGAGLAAVLRGVETALSCAHNWVPPAEYMSTTVSDIVLRILLQYRSKKCHDAGLTE